MNDLSEAIEQLSHNMEALEHRVAALEGARDGRTARPAANAAVTAPLESTEAHALEESGLFPVLGKSMLVVAGAYLLRAVAASTAAPRAPVVAVAILYAFLWLIPAAGARKRLPGIVWACTSAVILLPMLWELAVRLGVLPAAIAAAVLAAFVVAAGALSWHGRCAEVATVGGLAGSVTALVLALAVHDLAPFVGALLVMTLAGEIASARHRRLSARWMVAAAADFAVFALLWIYGGAAAARTEYPPIGTAAWLGLPLTLLLIAAAGACTQTLVLHRDISFAETGQALVAFLLAVLAVRDVSPAGGVRWLGISCLIAAAAGYAVVYTVFAQRQGVRNLHVFGTGSLLLVLVGCWLCLPSPAMQVLAGILAVAATVTGLRTRSLTPGFHGLAYLLAAAVSSHQLSWAGHALVDGFPASTPGIAIVISACSLFCYAAATRLFRETRGTMLLRLLHAALAVVSIAALLVWGLVRITASGSLPAAEHLALIRTLAACGLAPGLAWSGARLRLRELIWLSWAALVFVAGKLLFEDLRHGHLAYAAAAIFAFAVTLLTVPRLQRAKADPAWRAQVHGRAQER